LFGKSSLYTKYKVYHKIIKSYRIIIELLTAAKTSPVKNSLCGT